MHFKFEYIFFIIIVLYFSYKEYVKFNSEVKEMNNIVKNKILIKDSEIMDINGKFIPDKKFFNDGVVYKHEKNDYWIYKVIENISEFEENCYWIISKKNPFDLNENVTSCSENEIIYHSVNIVDIGDFYLYQYVDFGRSISNNDLCMYNKKNDKEKIILIII
tara:strand:+ start:286 stop:771 length:486 start_codon:yes stop_codon:yes gene_type:complete